MPEPPHRSHREHLASYIDAAAILAWGSLIGAGVEGELRTLIVERAMVLRVITVLESPAVAALVDEARARGRKPRPVRPP